MKTNRDREIQSWTSHRKRTPAESDSAVSAMLMERGLCPSANDPPPIFMMVFIGEVLYKRAEDAHKMGQPQDARIDPIDFAQSMGKTAITWDVYMDQLTQTGLDVDELRKQTLASTVSVESKKKDNETKANAFFEMLVNPDFFGVTDEQIHAHLNSGSIYHFVGIVVENANVVRARVSAQAKLVNDPKQKEKALVRDSWELWEKDPTRYKSKAAFAKDMLSKYESLESARVIERWCKEWESVPS